MNRNITHFCAIIILILFCPLSFAKDNRELAIAITLGEQGDFNEALKKAESAGMNRRAEMQINWNEIESSPEIYTYDVVNTAKNYFLIKDTPIILTISPFYNLEDTRPNDLRDLAIDHPRVVSRFNKMLSWVFAELKKADIDVGLFVFGNEFDLYLGVEYAIKANDLNLWITKWQEITNLYESTYKHVKSLSSNTLITTEITMDSLLGNAKAYSYRMNQKSDVIGISHYMKNIHTTIHEPPDKVIKYFDEITKLYPNKPIYFLQYGYSSKFIMGSSEELQRQFIENSFKAWDKYKQSIQYICFTWLYELHPNHAKQMISKFGVVDKKTLGFFGGIGLIDFNGTEKPAFKELIEQANERGFIN